MSNHSDKIYNGLCVECLSNYGRILNEKQTEINKLVNEMRNLTFPHLDITMISKSEVQTIQVENTRDELMTNIFPTQKMLEKKDEILKSIKEELKEEISNIPKKKMGRPKKVLLIDIKPLYSPKTRRRGKSLKTLEKEKALQESQNSK